MRQKYALFLRLARVGVFFLREAAKYGCHGDKRGREMGTWRGDGDGREMEGATETY